MTRFTLPLLGAASLLLVACGGAAPPASSTVVVVDAHQELTLAWSVTAVIEARGASEPERARTLAREVSRAYARYVRAKRGVEIARAREERLASLGPTVSARVASGMAPVAESDAVQHASARAHVAVVSAEDELRVAASALASLFGRAGDAPLPPPADAGPATVVPADLAALEASADRPGDPPAEVAREIEDAHGRLLALVDEWQRLGAPTDAVAREQARYEAGLAPLSELLSALDAEADAATGRAELAARIADASTEVEHAVGARLAREPLGSP